MSYCCKWKRKPIFIVITRVFQDCFGRLIHILLARLATSPTRFSPLCLSMKCEVGIRWGPTKKDFYLLACDGVTVRNLCHSKQIAKQAVLILPLFPFMMVVYGKMYEEMS